MTTVCDKELGQEAEVFARRDGSLLDVAGCDVRQQGFVIGMQFETMTLAWLIDRHEKSEAKDGDVLDAEEFYCMAHWAHVDFGRRARMVEKFRRDEYQPPVCIRVMKQLKPAWAKSQEVDYEDMGGPADGKGNAEAATSG